MQTAPSNWGPPKLPLLSRDDSYPDPIHRPFQNERPLGNRAIPSPSPSVSLSLFLSFFSISKHQSNRLCDISNCFRYTYDQKILFEDLIVIVAKKSFRFERMSGGGKVEKWKVLARRRLTIEATVRRVTIMRVFNARSLDSNYSHEVDKPSLRMVGLIKRATHAGST